MVNLFACKPHTVKFQVYAEILCSNIFTMAVVLRDTTQNTSFIRTESCYYQNHATCYIRTQFLIVIKANKTVYSQLQDSKACCGQGYLNTTLLCWLSVLTPALPSTSVANTLVCKYPIVCMVSIHSWA
jgi:hypothetical protein